MFRPPQRRQFPYGAIGFMRESSTPSGGQAPPWQHVLRGCPMQSVPVSACSRPDKLDCASEIQSQIGPDRAASASRRSLQTASRTPVACRYSPRSNENADRNCCAPTNLQRMLEGDCGDKWFANAKTVFSEKFGAQKTSLQARFEQVAIAVLGHPVRACQMTVIYQPGAFRFSYRIDPEYD